MTEGRDDPIIDACLEEVLGNRTPPDLTVQIVQAWASRTGGSLADGAAAGVPVAPPVECPAPPVEAPPISAAAPMMPLAPPVQGPRVSEPPVQLAPTPVPRGRTRSAASRWMMVGVAAGLLISASLLGVLLFKMYSGELGLDVGTVAKGDPDSNGGPDGVKDSGFVDIRADGTRPPPDPTPEPRHVALPDAEVIKAVNDAVRRRWQEHDITPAPRATGSEWVRRTHLRFVGRIPTAREVQLFGANESQEKRSELLDELLASDAFADEYARTWTSFWSNVLIGRIGGTQEDSPVSREGLQAYLRESFAENKPFDRMAYELISATGANTPGSEDFNGATNFVLSGLDSDGILAAAKTSRIFLGKQLQCAQCHDHPLNRNLAQGQFWELAAFFQQSQMVREGNVVRLANRDVTGQGGDNPNDVGLVYQLRNGLRTVAYPVFVDGTELPRSGRLADVDRRTQLAGLVVRSQDFCRAVVNRTWAHILGRGFTWPVDDMGPHNRPSHPELLDYLAEQFAAHDYDYRSLVRWIALSDVFSLSCQITDGNCDDDPKLAKAPLFSRYYARPMQPEDVYESLLALAETERGEKDYAAAEAAKLQWLGQFTIDLETDDGSELSIFDTSYTQKLEMMGGALVTRATDRTNENGLLYRVIQGSMTPREKVEHLFLASLARPPTEDEAAAVHQLIEDRRDDLPAALEDIWWALLNSSEFLLDH